MDQSTRKEKVPRKVPHHSKKKKSGTMVSNFEEENLNPERRSLPRSLMNQTWKSLSRKSERKYVFHHALMEIRILTVHICVRQM